MTPEPVSSERRGLFLIPLAAGVALLPLIVHGCSCGHDFDFHLLNWMEAARQFSLGNLHPHWAFSPAFNAGEPRFVFYPPLSWALGALLGLLLTHLPGVSAVAGWTAAPILFTWIALTASGFTMARLARAYAGANAALLAATLYLANPYMLFTTYERTAYAELLAAAWIPLLLHAILREKVSVHRIALPVALLWLTNVPAAITGSYTLALLAALRIAAQLGAPRLATETRESCRRFALQLALKTIAGTALGLVLAAFYIVPAAYESRFVQIAMATIADMRIDRNFLFEHMGTLPDDLLHDQVLRTVSLIAVILLAVTAVTLAATRRVTRPGAPRLASETWESRRNIPFPTLPLTILTAGIAFQLTPLSAPIWNHAPEAVLLQFPWRLLLIVAPIFALATAAALSRLALKFAVTSVVVLALATSLTFPAYHFFHQPCDPQDTAPTRLTLFQSNAGTDPADEYTPTTADNDVLKPNNPPYWLADEPNAAAPATAAPGSAPMHVVLTAPRAEDLILNLRDYPAWRITLNGALDPTRARRPDGLIAIPIPAGASTIDIRYAHTLDQTLGDAITLLALLFLILRAKFQNPGSR
ncbi:MAG: hypothetical protein ABSG84_01550 [Acidobacteriaceae bacterium]|jgi:hypothetical protein